MQTNSLAPFGVCKVFMISKQMYFVVWILLHFFVMLNALEYHLTETIKVGDVGHLAVVNLVHQCSSLNRIVDLKGALVFISMFAKPLENRTTVHRFTPYLIMRSFVMGAEISFMCWRYASSLMPGFR